MWNGEESPNCDGNFFGFSNMTCILGTKGKKATDETKFTEIVTKYFEPNFNDDYTFQYRYRSRAISYYFKKEFVFGAILVYLLVVVVDLEYSSLFKAIISYISFQDEEGNDLGYDDEGKLIYRITEKGGSYDFASVDFDEIKIHPDDREQIFKDNLEVYKVNYTLVASISLSLAYAFVLKVLFNACTNSNEKGKRVGYDRWAVLDISSSVATLIIFPMMANSSAERLLNPDEKDNLDYIVCLLIVL